MSDTLHTEVTALLAQAGAAHHEYEQTALNGAHDAAWAEWYARWLLAHGLNDLLKQRYGVDSLGAELTALAEKHKASGDPAHWTAYYAAYLLQSAR